MKEKYGLYKSDYDEYSYEAKYCFIPDSKLNDGSYYPPSLTVQSYDLSDEAQILEAIRESREAIAFEEYHCRYSELDEEDQEYIDKHLNEALHDIELEDVSYYVDKVLKVNQQENDNQNMPLKNKIGLSMYGNIWRFDVPDQYLYCNEEIVISHYEIANAPDIVEKECVWASDHFDDSEVRSNLIIKVFDKEKINLEDFIKTMSSLKEHYGAIKIERDSINGELQIIGIKHKDYEKIGVINEDGSIKLEETALTDKTPYAKNKENLKLALQAFYGQFSYDYVLSDDKRDGFAADLLERLCNPEKFLTKGDEDLSDGFDL